MFGHLDGLTKAAAELLSELKPLPETKVLELRAKYPDCPEDYLSFLLERGSGEMEEGLMFFFDQKLVDAEAELFGDQEIYKYGAKGPIMIFGDDCSETSYGFDTGKDWQLVEVDSYRTVKHLDLTFTQFVEGMLVCYPDFPVSYADGVWKVATGEEYRINHPLTS